MDGPQWLNSWSNSMKGTKTAEKLPVFKDPMQIEPNPMHNLFNNKLPAVQTVPLISPSALSQLQQLYGKKPAAEVPAPDAEDNFSSIGTLSADRMETHIQLAKELEKRKKDKLTDELKDVSLD